MSALAEVHSWLIAFPRHVYDTRESWLRKVSRYYDIEPSFAKGLFYRKKTRIDADRYLHMRDRYAALKNAEKQYGEQHAQLIEAYKNVGANLPPDRGAGGPSVLGAAPAGGEIPPDRTGSR